jgi:hypothetical protein
MVDAPDGECAFVGQGFSAPDAQYDPLTHSAHPEEELP